MRITKISFWIIVFVVVFCLGCAGKAEAATLFSDNFDDNSISTTQWAETDTGSRLAESGGKITITGSSGSFGQPALFTSSTFTRATNTTFIATVNMVSSTFFFGFKKNVAGVTYTSMPHAIYFRYSGTNLYVAVYEDGNSRGNYATEYIRNTDYRIAIVLKTQGAYYYVQGGQFGMFGSNSWTLIYDSNYSTSTDLKAGMSSGQVSDPVTQSVLTMDDLSVFDNGVPIGDTFLFNNVMVAKPSTSSETIVIETNVTSTVSVSYGTTTAYGSVSATSSSDNIHKVVLPGLSPSTTYYYRVNAIEDASTTNVGYSDPSYFTTQLASGAPFKFASFGDLQGNDPRVVVSKILAYNPNIILTMGDNVEVTAAASLAVVSSTWVSGFFIPLAELTDHIPIFPTLGNHDAAGIDEPGSMNVYTDKFALPIAESGGVEQTYSFDYGDAHFASLNSYSADVSEAQLDWLTADMASSSKIWKIVYMHVPGENPSGVSNLPDATATALHAICTSTGVQLVMNGHSHIYHRWVKDGVFYVTTPIPDGSTWPALTDSTGDAGSLGTAIGQKGYVVGTVSSTQITISSYSTTNTLFDTFSISPNGFDIASPAGSTLTSSTPTFSWNASSQTDLYASPPLAISKYQLYIDGALNTDNISSTTLSTTSTGALADGAHTWYVKSVNNASKSTQSNSTFSLTVDGTAPTITSISSDKTNGTYGVGEVIDIDITFSEAVTSTGNVTITLNTGRTCTFSITSATTGTCNYTVQAGDNSSDLNATVTGTIADALGNLMTNFTPVTGLSVGKNIVVDALAPTITSISSDKTNGTYGVDEVIDIDVTFSEAVTSTGNITITLETGDTDRTCTFTITNATTGTCNYTVQTGDTSLDLNATASGTIADVIGNVMTNFTPATGLSANKALVIDTIVVSTGGSSYVDTSPPINTSITINNGASLTTTTVVTLTLGAVDASWMIIDNSSDFTNGLLESYATSKSWTLTSGSGTKNVYVKFRDSSGNESIPIYDSITLTTTPLSTSTPPTPPTSTTPTPPVVNPSSPDASCPTLIAGDMVKVIGKPAIYAVNKYLQTLYFPSGDEFKSWRPTYGGYKSITQACFDSLNVPTSYPAAVNYRPGSYLIKRASSDQLYVIEPNNTLSKISSTTAQSLYGTSAYAGGVGYKIMTIADPFWPHYINRNPDITSIKVHPGMLIKTNNIIYYIDDNNQLREVTDTGFTANQFQQRFVRAVPTSAIQGITIGDKIISEIKTITDKMQSGE